MESPLELELKRLGKDILFLEAAISNLKKDITALELMVVRKR